MSYQLEYRHLRYFQAVADESATPMILIVGLIAACVVGGNVAKRILPEVDRALKASGVIPSME